MATPKIARFRVLPGDMSYDMNYDIEMSMESVIRMMTEDFAKYTAEGWTDLTFRQEESRRSDREYFYLYGSRMETMEEAETREAEEARLAAIQEEREKREYERLSAKYNTKHFAKRHK